jgi:hypothetical protein
MALASQIPALSVLTMIVAAAGGVVLGTIWCVWMGLALRRSSSARNAVMELQAETR